MANGFVDPGLFQGPASLAQLRARLTAGGAPPTVIFSAQPQNIYNPNAGEFTLPPAAQLEYLNFLNRQASSGPAGGVSIGVGSGFTPRTAVQSSAAGAREALLTLGYAGCRQLFGMAVCDAAAALLGMVIPGNGTSMPMGGGTVQNGGGAMGLADCPSGYTKVGTQCVKLGAMLPGGMPFTTAQGAFGIPAAAPMQVSSITLRCPPGLILGKDDLCYPKGALPRRARKWVPAPRPVISGSDSKALRRVAQIKNRVKRAASSAGFSCVTKGRRFGKPKRK